MGGRGGNSTGNAVRVNTASRSIAETWRDNLPASAKPKQADAINSIFKYLENDGAYTNLEVTELSIKAFEPDPDFPDLKVPQDLSVRLKAERKDREESAYLNALDTVHAAFMVGRNGGMYTYDGNQQRVGLNARDVTSRAFWNDLNERQSRQYRRRKAREVV